MIHAELAIAGRQIGVEHPPYVIAEMSANHNGSLQKAMAIIDAAVEAGADAVKLQTYRPDTITLPCDGEEFQIYGGLWHGRTLYELYAEAHMPWDWHAPLVAHARRRGITLFSSPFDETAVDLLRALDMPAYKIASFELVDLPLIRYVAASGRPMILSTGMANAEEMSAALAAAREGGCQQLALLHCVSGYPAPAADYHLRTLLDMQQRFGVVIGLSDHTLDNTTAITSVALGAAIIEKHFTLDRSGGGPDDSFSLEPVELAALCRGVRTAWEALGQVRYDCKPSEQANIQFRRSLYFIRDIEQGREVTRADVRSVRPGFGLAPACLEQVLGCRVRRRISAMEAVRAEDLEGFMMPALPDRR
ncbi:MAG: hypothetical protein RIQ52_306 [Pseudomonadota bacterium]